jgi:hypothetical protein
VDNSPKTAIKRLMLLHEVNGAAPNRMATARLKRLKRVQALRPGDNKP